ncbi:hypothetical protein GCM10025776_29910 [Corallincola platygyrae]
MKPELFTAPEGVPEREADLWLMADNHCQLSSTQIRWESFPDWAVAFCQSLDLKVMSKDQGADRHVWHLQGWDIELLLQYEEMSATVWIEALRNADWPALQASLKQELSFVAEETSK